jgi:hypothetical protein
MRHVLAAVLCIAIPIAMFASEKDSSRAKTFTLAANHPLAPSTSEMWLYSENLRQVFSRMAFKLEDLLPDGQQLRTVQLHEPVGLAINIMRQHEYDQLPVAGADRGSLGQVVTFESILGTMQAFRTGTESLLVRDVAQRVRSYRRDADLLATLDDIHRDKFAVIVDEKNRLTGIVTTADIAVFFREYAQDLMQIEGIESLVKDAIRALYADDKTALESATAIVSDRTSEIRRRLPGAVRAYFEKVQVGGQTEDAEALAEAEKRLGLSGANKEFDDLTFDEFINVLLRHPRAPKLSQAKDGSELRGLLQQVRDTRNKLAHFRGEVSPDERRTIQVAAEWLESNLPVAPVEEPRMSIAAQQSQEEEEDETGPHGSYAPLAAYLAAQPPGALSVPLTFQDIEGILEDKLPPSAGEHRAWWSNDPTKPQSAAWLDEGWRTTSVNMSEGRLTFVRTNDREEAYILFFAKLNGLLAADGAFSWRNSSPQGQSWHIVASLDKSHPDTANVVASFARRKRLRIELYIDTKNKDANKERFDRLLMRRREIENMIGEPLHWERMDNRRASRVAVYTKAQILTDAADTALLNWAAKQAASFRRVFEPEFSTE